jgi:hypothetical protein
MTDYLPALISLIAGVLAFFFAKTGERNKVSGVGWAMAALLVGGGLFGLYVLFEKQSAAAEAKVVAAQQADKAAVAAAKQSALVMTLVGDFDLKQVIPDVTLLFEFPYVDDANPAIVDGFVGPFPALGADVVGRFDFVIGDVASSSFELRSGGPDHLLLSREGSVETYDLSNTGVTLRGPQPRHDEDQAQPAGGWAAGPEPAPSGFTYHLISPANTQLRRLLYAIVSQEPLGYVRFPRGAFGEAGLERIERGFAANPPMLAFFIPETEAGEPCNSYVHIPLRFVRSVTDAESEFDTFELRLTPAGFVPDPCNNNPF